MKHLILYDGNCPLCNRAIRVILKEDRKKVFAFAPLQGKTASHLLSGSPLLQPPFHTLVLMENFKGANKKIYTEAQGSLRIAYHLGGKFFLFGLLSFLPPFLFNTIYRFIAKHRYKMFAKTVKIDPKDFEDRFLP